MAFEKEKEFLAKMMFDEGLRTKVDAADPDQIVKIAQEAGYDITGEDLEKAAKEARAEADSKGVKMSVPVDDMDKVAGGSVWGGDDAPDGHEMGCAIFYHGWDWQEKHNIYCKEMYYCLSRASEMQKLSREK